MERRARAAAETEARERAPVAAAPGPAAGGATGSAGRGGTTGSAGTGGSAGRGGAGGSAGTTGSGGSAGGRGGSTGGGGAGGTTSPCQAVLALDRSCTTAADCFAGAHTSNCCGQSAVHRFPQLGEDPVPDARSAVRPDLSPLRLRGGTADGRRRLAPAIHRPGRRDLSARQVHDVRTRLRTALRRRHDLLQLHQSQPTMFAACTTMCADSNACLDPTLPLCQMGMSGNTSGKFCTAANVACDIK